jgi:hypothetical protein
MGIAGIRSVLNEVYDALQSGPRTRACRTLIFWYTRTTLHEGWDKWQFLDCWSACHTLKSVASLARTTHCISQAIRGTRARPHTRAPYDVGGARVWVMFIYIDIRCRCRPCADLGRCAPSVRLGTPSELGARSSLLAALAPTRLPPRSDGGFPSPPLRDGALRRPRLGRRLAAAPPRGSAALGPASVGLGRAGEGYEHSARLAAVLAALRSSESAPRALVTSRTRQKCLSEPLKAILSDFHPAGALPDGYAPVRPPGGLTAPPRPGSPGTAVARLRRSHPPPSVKG